MAQWLRVRLPNAGDMGLCPGLGRSHMPRSGWAREPWLLSLRVRSLCSTTGEATTGRGPRTAKKKKKERNAHWSVRKEDNGEGGRSQTMNGPCMYSKCCGVVFVFASKFIR